MGAWRGWGGIGEERSEEWPRLPGTKKNPGPSMSQLRKSLANLEDLVTLGGSGHVIGLFINHSKDLVLYLKGNSEQFVFNREVMGLELHFSKPGVMACVKFEEGERDSETSREALCSITGEICHRLEQEYWPWRWEPRADLRTT